MYIAYTDGSYYKGDKSCGFGIYLYNTEDENDFVSIYGKETRKDYVDMWNVGGEITAVETLLNYCIDNKIPGVKIYHDYIGLAHWVSGKWKTNKPATKSYSRNVKMLESIIDIDFEHVKGHSGNKYNEYVDRLANNGRYATELVIDKSTKVK